MANPNNALKRLRESKMSMIDEFRFSSMSDARAQAEVLRGQYPKPSFVVRVTTQTLRYPAKRHREAHVSRYYWVRVYQK